MTAMTKTRAAMLRRLILLGLAILVAAIASNAAAPATADAIFVDYRVPASHQGWVYVKSSAADVCTRSLPPQCRASAWRWSGSAWTQSSVSTSTQVYAYPYASGWHWIWTQHTGWLAIETNKLERYRFACGVMCA
jgi:hypothetical protein